MKDNPWIRTIHRAGLLLVPLGLLGAAPVRESTKPKPDPAPLNALKSMGAYLRTLKGFSVVVEGARDEVLADGQKIQLAGTITYVVCAPDRLRAEIRTDRKQRVILYDGKTLTMYAPRMQYYATVPAPATILATLDTARVRYDIEFPLADLFLWGTPRDGVSSLTSAQYIGPGYVDGVDTDHYAFRQPGTDWQIWIERGKTPLPRKLVITTTSEPTQPQYVATLKWDLTSRADESVFTFVPPKGAAKIAITSATAQSMKRARTAER
jgi:hypothetical protein